MGKEETRTYVAAQPDWYLIVILGGDDDPLDRAQALIAGYLCYEPIIAWALDHHQGDYHPEVGRPPGERYSVTHVWPVTMSGEANDNKNWAIKTPDGEFEFKDFVLQNEEELLKAWNEHRAAKAKLRQ